MRLKFGLWMEILGCRALSNYTKIYWAIFSHNQKLSLHKNVFYTWLFKYLLMFLQFWKITFLFIRQAKAVCFNFHQWPVWRNRQLIDLADVVTWRVIFLTDGIGIQNDLAKLEKQIDSGRKTLKNDKHNN